MKTLTNNGLFFLVSTVIILGGCVASPPMMQYDSESILINQIGYGTGYPKKALSKLEADAFSLVDTIGNTVFTGSVGPASYWELSGDTVRVLDFSTFDTPGTYRICVDETCSYTFRIGQGLFNDLADAALKSYYYARCSEEIPTAFGGQWSRAAGHPDTTVYIHASAADKHRHEGSVISSPGGWYDAGDYGKYIVNSSITTWTLLKSVEINRSFHQEQLLKIPESTNDLPDALDEALVNLKWMLSMQDPKDGGVYHKLTTKGFDGFILPEATSKERFVVQKSTSATLDFAATMAAAARLLTLYQQLDLADQMIAAAEKAWNWSLQHPDLTYVQPEDISTGAYPDTHLQDEWFWAAAELYLGTSKEEYKMAIDDYYLIPVTPKWDVVQALGVISLITSEQADIFPSMKADFLNYANQMLKQEASSPYLISMQSFAWGSNSDVGNDGMLKIIAFELTGDSKYLHSAHNDLAYILGRNTTGYSFVTGYGSKTPQVPHNRIFSADGIDAPIPGYIVGGPNTVVLTDCAPIEVARSSYPAASYVDVECSYSTNETAINWNAPLVFLSSAITRLERNQE